MKIILLRGDGRKPVTVHIDRWSLIMSVFFLLAIFMIANSVSSGIYSSPRTEIVKGNIQRSIGGLSGIPSEPNLRHVNEAELLESIKRSEKKLSEQNFRLKVFQPPPYKTQSNKATSKAIFDLDEVLDVPQLYSKPVDIGYISSKYGMRVDPINGAYRKHNGIDIAAKKGSVIRAIGSGFVTFVGKKGGYGNVIEIHHSDSLKSRYAHLNRILVKEGEVIRQGSSIAKMGRTGRATGPHLHLEVWRNGVAVNPEEYLGVIGHRLASKL